MISMFLADGFEETEALVTLDMMRRAGIDVKTVGIGSNEPVGAHGIIVKTDVSSEEFSSDGCEGIILPGGMPGTENLYNSRTVTSALEYCMKKSLLVAAICAAPIIPGRMGFLKNKKAVCFPGFENELLGADIANMLCVKDGNIITAKGAGCVFEFSHSIISTLRNSTVADKIICDIQHKGL